MSFFCGTFNDTWKFGRLPVNKMKVDNNRVIYVTKEQTHTSAFTPNSPKSHFANKTQNGWFLLLLDRCIKVMHSTLDALIYLFFTHIVVDTKPPMQRWMRMCSCFVFFME